MWLLPTSPWVSGSTNVQVVDESHPFKSATDFQGFLELHAVRVILLGGYADSHYEVIAGGFAYFRQGFKQEAAAVFQRTSVSVVAVVYAPTEELGVEIAHARQ